MNPNQTWEEMLKALKRKDWDKAEKLALALNDWLNAGKAPPHTVGDQSLGKRWHRTVASFVCLCIINKVKKIRNRHAKQKGEV